MTGRSHQRDDSREPGGRRFSVGGRSFHAGPSHRRGCLRVPASLVGPAMPNGRCRTGAAAPVLVPDVGLERSRRARWRHGVYSREVRDLLASNRRRWRALRALLDGM